MSGYLLLSFVDGSRVLNIERHGLADVILKKKDLQSWFRGYYAKALRKYGFSFKEVTGEAAYAASRSATSRVAGNDNHSSPVETQHAVSLHNPSLATDDRMEMLGQEKRLIDHIPFSPIFAVDTILRRKQVAASFWHCRESNRIFVVMAMSKRGADELVSHVASSIRCHEV